MNYHWTSRVICAFSGVIVPVDRTFQAGGAIITFPSAITPTITVILAFVVRPSPFATDKFLITRVNWPDCNCRCACYRYSHWDAPDPAPKWNSLSTAENTEIGSEASWTGGGAGARLNARATYSRRLGPVGIQDSYGCTTASCAEFRKSS